ncbi:hypothetical protein [Alteromonas macleodii]|uniref:hypothetical protein n=1 Tax=Alteromonas macleodii TaxID=28108 RepID=UPI002076B32C|nr:hypothetical protein [Alteromonas macleodii]USI27904.1 hypothetical protein NFG60_19705 [Alteromonas macleodii]
MKKKKCKDTKRLVRLAVDSGMTNKDIAKKAGLSPSSLAQVSRWRRGESLATERQMGFLIKEFGDLLRRKSEHLLTVIADDTLRYIKLTGDLVLKHVVREKIRVERKMLNVAIIRFLIFRRDDCYYILYQQRKGYNPNYSVDIKELSHSDNEDANWVSVGIPKLLSLDDMVKCVDSLAKDLTEGRLLKEKNCTFSAQEFQFSIRRYLLREGIYLSDVIDISNEN